MRSLLKGMGVRNRISHGSGEVGVTFGVLHATVKWREAGEETGTSSTTPSVRPTPVAAPESQPDPEPASEPESESEWSPPVYEFWIEDGQDYCAQW